METIDELLNEFAQGVILEEQVKEAKRLMEKTNDKS